MGKSLFTMANNAVHAYVTNSSDLGLLNQARPGHRMACTWFLKIECVCLPSRLLITSGVMWHDVDSIRLVKQVL